MRSGLGLWLEDVPLERVTCITGTKGKSTTTAIAGHLLTRLGYSARVGGNIGHPPWEPSTAPEPDFWVIETSSYQVPDLTNGPPVVAVTSLVARPPRLARLGRALLRRQAVAVHQARGHDLGRRRDQRGAAEHASNRWGPTCNGWTPTTSTFGGPWVEALGLPGSHNVRNAPSPVPCCWRWASPRRATMPRWQRLPKDSADYPADAVPSATSVRSSSSTTASRPTSCRPRPLSRRTAIGRWPCWSVATTAASTTRPWAAPWPPAAPHPRGHHARQRAADRAAPSARCRRRPGRRRRRRPAWMKPSPPRADGPARAASSSSPRRRPSFGRYADYQDRARAFAEAASRCGPLTEDPT